MLQDVKPPFWDGTTINLPPVVRLGRPHRRRAAQPAVSRLAEHQPDAGRRDQPDEGRGPPHDQGRLLQQPQLQGAEHRRRRHRQPELPGLRQLRQRHEQRPRHRLRLRERGAGRLHAVPAGVEVHRRQHALQQHRVLRPGQLEGEQPADARLRRALHAPAAAVRPVPADVELLPRTVVGGARRRCSTSPGCSNGAVTCSGNTRNAMDPRTGQILTAPGAANTQAAIGTPIPGTGNPLNGISQAGDGIAKTATPGRRSSSAPRFGVAYDVTGNQTLDLPRRRRPVLRPSGRQHRVLDPGQPADRDVAGSAQRPAADARPGPEPRPACRRWSPSSTTRRCRRRRSGRSASRCRCRGPRSLDVSYVGNHGFNRLAASRAARRST